VDEPTDGEVLVAASDRVDRKDMAERSLERPCFVRPDRFYRANATWRAEKSAGCP
jgi:hypothetical protein